MAKMNFKIWRGLQDKGGYQDYSTEITDGMVVLDAVHQIQKESASDLACRWNCKAGKCGSCSAEVNGNPRLMCMTRMSDLPTGEPVTIESHPGGVHGIEVAGEFRRLLRRRARPRELLAPYRSSSKVFAVADRADLRPVVRQFCGPLWPRRA